MYKKFVVTYVVLLLLLLLVSTPLIVLLYKHSEISDYDDLIEKQQAQGAIFASLLDQNTMPYKLELIDYRKPNVVAIGSSTSMQFREDFFAKNSEFINAGGAAASVEDLYRFSEAMLIRHKPDLVILGIDFWWVNPNRSNPVRPIAGTLPEFNFRKVIDTARFLWSVEDPMFLFGNVLNYSSAMIHPKSGLPVIGFSALTSSDGYRPDGSRLYYQYVAGQRKSADVNFNGTLQRIEQNRSRFDYASELDFASYRILLNTIQLYKTHNVATVVFLPPVAPVIADLLESMTDEYKYISELKKEAKRNGWYDYLTPNTISRNECEFIDGFHMGDVLAQRLLIDLAHDRPLVGSHLNHEIIRHNIEKFSGHILSLMPSDQLVDELVEIDFLGLGCNKG
ncbi:hypothetical protein [Bermanella sp. R86510]|uniref:hypothetical protein n=1 Tax=unclassified Bermanella TaxID=2627862 RepID=UPI0037CCAE60